MEKSTTEHNFMLNEPRIGRTIKKQARKNKSIIYGGKALMKQVPFFLRRGTYDYDVYSNKPKKSARQLEKKLDRQFGGDFFYVKEAEHKGTFRVMNHGINVKDPKDDRNVADYSREPRKVKTRRIEGNRYASLSEVKKDKERSVRNPKFKFRHRKDREDLQRIKAHRKIRRLF